MVNGREQERQINTVFILHREVVEEVNNQRLWMQMVVGAVKEEAGRSDGQRVKGVGRGVLVSERRELGDFKKQKRPQSGLECRGRGTRRDRHAATVPGPGGHCRKPLEHCEGREGVWFMVFKGPLGCWEKQQLEGEGPGSFKLSSAGVT